jgi:uncharacterized protein YjbI with pentapeptide repeats
MSQKEGLRMGAQELIDKYDTGEREFHGADLRGAILYEVNLAGANLSGANLSGVDLKRACLDKANLSGADLGGDIITDEQLAQASSLKGATLPDGSMHE